MNNKFTLKIIRACGADIKFHVMKIASITKNVRLSFFAAISMGADGEKKRVRRKKPQQETALRRA